MTDRLRNMRRIGGLADELERLGGGEFAGRMVPVEHHRAHQASSFYVSGFDEAVLLSVDGFGDFASASWGVGRGRDIRIDGRVYFPHSLGVFYLALTQYLGFPKYGDEYKVMGLAPYGRPEFTDVMRRIVRVRDDGEYRLDLGFFRHAREDLEYRWEGGAPTVERHYTEKLEEVLGPARSPSDELTQRHMDIARAVQVRFEEAVIALLRQLHDRYGLDDVAVSGGAGMNSVANGKIIRETPFHRVFLPPGPGDAGGAIGAALVAWSDADSKATFESMIHSSYGPGWSDSEIDEAIESVRSDLDGSGCSVRIFDDLDALCEEAADRIAEGQILGWFQGRSEFGPRALGNRSIVCDPSRENMRDVINAKIKLRESFRPFAPSVLREAMSEWFVVDDDVPFMMKVYEIREEVRDRIPAVTHVDGTGRPHTVTEEANPAYRRLIEKFYERTGVPMVLNTSFNENEPIVNRPEEALDFFLRTDMDTLV
ncbi:MAG: carbamoyltransferase C-terminal domain-containing protein, partial [Thermoanaerobaculia bacterium]|nr:carbamoyltransferase C-terminal domain-containing protein [Thermoanaerobaculia bacterium]